MQKFAYKISNRLVGKSEYLLIKYKHTEFISRIEPNIQCSCAKFDFYFLNLEKTTFCVPCFFYSFTASDGSEEFTAGHLVSPCSSMMHRGLRSKNYAKQHHTPHCWLTAKVKYPANSTKCFSWLTRSTSISLMKNVQIYTLALVPYDCLPATLPFRIFYWDEVRTIYRPLQCCDISFCKIILHLLERWHRAPSYISTAHFRTCM